MTQRKGRRQGIGMRNDAAVAHATGINSEMHSTEDEDWACRISEYSRSAFVRFSWGVMCLATNCLALWLFSAEL